MVDMECLRMSSHTGGTNLKTDLLLDHCALSYETNNDTNATK